LPSEPALALDENKRTENIVIIKYRIMVSYIL